MLALSGCAATGERGQPAAETASASNPTATLRVAPATITGSFPAVGVAVADSASEWCAAFPDSLGSTALAPGQRVTIIFVRPARVPAWGAQVRRRRASPCPTAFGQPRWEGYAAYDLALIDSLRQDAGDTPGATLAVAGGAKWARGADGVVRVDLDGDGVLEEARVCTADEGEHFTLWSMVSATERRRRRAHEYFDWGAMTDPTCGPGERGEDEQTRSPP